MNLSRINEFDLIRRFSKRFSQDIPRGVIGIGDDCSVTPLSSGMSTLVTTDLLVENVHFLRWAIPAKDLGHKALAVSLSDIAAMGGRPTSAYLSLALTPDLSLEWVDDFFKGFGELASVHRVNLLGGDTTRSHHDIVINVTVIGNAQTDRVKLRSSARAGDLICVTGTLGDSAGGLHAIQNRVPETQASKFLIEQHHRPDPNLCEGEWLASHSSVGAMMDTSDGIDSDLRRIMESSDCGARVDVESVPISPELRSYAQSQLCDPTEWALTGGEDYRLLFTVCGDFLSQVCKDFRDQFHRSLFPIGEITSERGKLEYRSHGIPYRILKAGFSHFAGDFHED